MRVPELPVRRVASLVGGVRMRRGDGCEGLDTESDGGDDDGVDGDNGDDDGGDDALQDMVRNELRDFDRRLNGKSGPASGRK